MGSANLISTPLGSVGVGLLRANSIPPVVYVRAPASRASPSRPLVRASASCKICADESQWNEPLERAAISPSSHLNDRPSGVGSRLLIGPTRTDWRATQIHRDRRGVHHLGRPGGIVASFGRLVAFSAVIAMALPVIVSVCAGRAFLPCWPLKARGDTYDNPPVCYSPSVGKWQLVEERRDQDQPCKPALCERQLAPS